MALRLSEGLGRIRYRAARLVHYEFVGFRSGLCGLTSGCFREAKVLEQRNRPEVARLEDCKEPVHSVRGGQLSEHCVDRTTTQPLTPELASKFVRYVSDTGLLDGGLGIPDQFTAR